MVDQPGVALESGTSGRRRRADPPSGCGWVTSSSSTIRSLVFDALGLELGDRLAAGLGLLGVQHLARILQGRLDHRQHIQGEGVGLDVEQLDGGQRERWTAVGSTRSSAGRSTVSPDGAAGARRES